MSYRALRSITAIAILLVAVVAGQLELPSTVKTCKRDTADYSSCLRLAIQESWPTFVKGIPELDMPPLDPYYTEKQEGEYRSRDIYGKIVVKNANTYGIAKTRFLAVRPHFTDNGFHLEVDVEMPKVLVEGDYKAEGSLGTFKMGGKGFFNISMEDVKATWDIEGTVENDRWTIKHFRLMPEVGSMKVWFSDLFNGDKNLNNAAMAFVNEYWPVLYRGMLPIVSQAWDEQLTAFANRIFSKISFSKTFP